MNLTIEMIFKSKDGTHTMLFDRVRDYKNKETMKRVFEVVHKRRLSFPYDVKVIQVKVAGKDMTSQYFECERKYYDWKDDLPF